MTLRWIQIPLTLTMLLVPAGCCSMGRVVGSLPKPEDESGKLRKHASHGMLFDWHLYPKYLPNWSYHDERYRITVGVEDWKLMDTEYAYSGPDLSLSPLSNNPEALVVWLAMEPKSGDSLSLDPARVRISSSTRGFSAEPSCIVLGRKWQDGMHCQLGESQFLKSVLAAYTRVISRPMGTLTVTKLTYAFLIFQKPAQHLDLRLSITGLETGGEVVSVPELRLAPWEYKELTCMDWY